MILPTSSGAGWPVHAEMYIESASFMLIPMSFLILIVYVKPPTGISRQKTTSPFSTTTKFEIDAPKLTRATVWPFCAGQLLRKQLASAKPPTSTTEHVKPAQ